MPFLGAFEWRTPAMGHSRRLIIDPSINTSDPPHRSVDDLANDVEVGLVPRGIEHDLRVGGRGGSSLTSQSHDPGRESGRQRVSLTPALFDHGLDVVRVERTLDGPVEAAGAEDLSVVPRLVEDAVTGVQRRRAGNVRLERRPAEVGGGRVLRRDVRDDLPHSISDFLFRGRELGDLVRVTGARDEGTWSGPSW